MMASRLKRLAAIAQRHVAGLAAALVTLVIFGAPAAGNATSCSVSGPILLLGTVNPYSGTSTTTSGTGSFTCTNTDIASNTLYACVSLGTGTGGTSPTNRTLSSGSTRIPVQITAGGASGQIGNGTSYPMLGPLVFTVQQGEMGGGTYPLVVIMPPPVPAPTPGSYTSSFAGTDAQFIYYSGTSSTTCSSLLAGTHHTAPANFSISATVATQCKVSATSLTFPIASVLAQPVTATATVSVTCNASIPVTIALDNGATGTGPTVRQMKSGATNAITYGIYRDVAATLPWGNTAGTTTASLGGGTGTLTAYGRVPVQTSPPPGAYSDVVNVIITY